MACVEIKYAHYRHFFGSHRCVDPRAVEHCRKKGGGRWTFCFFFVHCHVRCLVAAVYLAGLACAAHLGLEGMDGHGRERLCALAVFHLPAHGLP